MSMNVVIVQGNLTRDPEMKQTTTGKAVARMGLAVNDGYGDKKKTFFFDVTCWEKKAEFAANYLKKGSRVLIQGRLEQRTWEKDGQKRSAVEIVAFDIQGLDRAAKPAADAQQAGDHGDAVGDDGVPF